MAGRGRTWNGRAKAGVADTIVTALVYLAAVAALAASLDGALSLPDAEGGVRRGVANALLLVLPLALAAVLALHVAGAVRNYRKGAWGARLRWRTMILFISAALAAALPTFLALGVLLARNADAPFSAGIRASLDAGIEHVLAYYEELDADLETLAERDLPGAAAANALSASGTLASLSGREPGLESLEFFEDGRSFSYAGPDGLRSEDGKAPMDASGFLPRLSIGPSGYIRYHARDAGTARNGGRLSATLAMRVPETAARAATALSLARRTLLPSGPESGKRVAFFVLAMLAPLLVLAFRLAEHAADSLLAPVGALDDAIRKVGAGERRAPYLAKPGDEAGALIESFNTMLERLERSRGDELRTERLLSWRDLARRLAHELRNPLTPIRLSAERVLKRWKEDPGAVGGILEKSMVAIIQEAANMESLLTEFRDFARLPEPHREWVRLRELVDESLYLYSASWPGLVLDASGVDSGIMLRADKGHIKQVLGNLVSNAAEVTSGRGRVWISADLVKTAESRYCRLQVRDDGPGIPEDAQSQVFRPYFSTKPGGTGLGLAIVEHIVAAHGGSIRFETAPGRGTVFILDLPTFEN
ncbi:MAG: HAMP domain-containing histidine kinase [Spirochaetales bacterium]|nr:HAMP domain-containing histidine kinase [Spirochaetales bacterium]